MLIDLDHVAESNINRQVQALGATLGQAKVLALRERIADIHPGCEVMAVEEFVEPSNWPALLPSAVDAVIDACDQVRAKMALAAWAPGQRAGRWSAWARPAASACAQRVEVDDLAAVTHDPLLAGLRQRLRKRAAPHARAASACAACFRASRWPSRPQPAKPMPTLAVTAPQLPGLRLQRHRHRHFRPGGRRRGHRTAAGAGPPWGA